MENKLKCFELYLKQSGKNIFILYIAQAFDLCKQRIIVMIEDFNLKRRGPDLLDFV